MKSILLVIQASPRKHICGEIWFSNIYGESFHIIITFQHLLPGFIMAGWDIFMHYYCISTFASRVYHGWMLSYYYCWAKCADIQFSVRFFACPSGTRVPRGPTEPKKGPYRAPIVCWITISNSTLKFSKFVQLKLAPLFYNGFSIRCTQQSLRDFTILFPDLTFCETWKWEELSDHKGNYWKTQFPHE